MASQGWRRFLPERSQVILLLIVVIVLLASGSFVNLGFAHSAAVAANRTARAQYDQMRRQQDRLLEALPAAQRGENILPKAYDYFFLTPAGAVNILLQPAPGESEANKGTMTAAVGPYWDDWWQHLTQP